MLRTFVAVAAFSVLLVFAASAQDAVPTEILTRTWFVKVGNETGTAFLFNHQGKVYSRNSITIYA
jgi:hypothetical protein